jgi:hypothetical protein
MLCDCSQSRSRHGRVQHASGCGLSIHTLLLLGSPEAGPPQLAGRLATILPEMRLVEAIETTRLPWPQAHRPAHRPSASDLGDDDAETFREGRHKHTLSRACLTSRLCRACGEVPSGHGMDRATRRGPALIFHISSLIGGLEKITVRPRVRSMLSTASFASCHGSRLCHSAVDTMDGRI